MSNVVSFNRSERRAKEREMKRMERKSAPPLNKEVSSMTEVDFSEMKIPLIVLYDKPVDFPDDIVARVFEIDHPTNVFVRYENAEDARNDATAAGFPLVVMRAENDDPHIVEVYLR